MGRMEQLLRDAAQRAVRYLRGLPDRPVAASPQALARLAELDVPLPDKPMADQDVLALLDEVVGPATTAMAGPRYFGFVIGGTLPAALAANWLAGAWDQNAALSQISPGTAAVEEVALRWLVDVLGLPSGTAGGCVTGATMANLTAVAAARHAVLAEVGWDVEAQGVFGAPPVTVVVGDEAHPTLLKALALLGFGRDRVTRVRTDGQGRLRPTLIPALTGPAIICAQAGNVNTGAVDPLAAICAQAHTDNAWVHVGRAGQPRPARTGRPHRADLRVRPAVRPGTVRRRLPGAQRGRPEPGAGQRRRRRTDRAGGRPDTGGRGVLVRKYGLAGPAGAA